MAARAKSKGGRKKPDHPGTPAPDRADREASVRSDYPTSAERQSLLPVMKPLSHGLTLAASTGFGGVGSRSSQLSVPGPQHGSLGKGGGRGHCTSSLPGKTNQGCWLGTPPHPEVKVRAVSTCENSQAGCLERECTAPRRVECGGQQQVQGSQ